MEKFPYGLPSRAARPPVLALCLGLFLSLSPAAMSAESGTAAVVPLGSFGSLRTGGDHCNGQSIDLWKSAETIRGVVSNCAGLIETKQTSVISNPRYDQNKGTVEFTINFSMGTDYLPGGKEAPSDDVWEYRLSIGSNALSGTVAKSDRNYPRVKPKIEKLSLKQQNKNLPSFDTLDEWTRWAAGGQK
jgi:hypothetical protein